MSKRIFLSIYLVIVFVSILLFIPACQIKETKAESTPVAEKPAAKFTPSNNTEPITIAAVGDIMLGSTSINETFLPPNDGAEMLKEAAPILSRTDLTFGNLEGPLLEGGTSAKCQSVSSQKSADSTDTAAPPAASAPAKTPGRCFAFRVPTRYGKYLKDAGFDVLNLANNHASDFGDYGRSSTRKVLDGLGIKHSGSDKTDFAYLTIKDKKIAFVSFTHNNISLNINDLDTARRIVAEQKKKADIVIVSFHGGAEGASYQHVPYTTEIFVGEQRGNLRAFTHTVIDAGADLVLGHGPHVMRGMEIYKDHLIVYSMGNFATYGMFNLKGPQGLTGIFELTIGADGKFLSGKINPAKQIGRGIPVLDKSGESIRVVRELSLSDFPKTAPKISDDGTISVK